MGLNKHGWSMKEMIIFSSILFAFLLLAVFYIMRLYHGLEQRGVTNHNSSNQTQITYTYVEIENKVLEAGLDYYNEYYDNAEDVKISTDRMIRHGYLHSKELKPSNDSKACTGYLQMKDGEPFAYINCSNYKTQGYEE